MSGRLLDSKLIRWGIAGLVLGTGPLVVAIVVGHLSGDANPNPVGPGILAGVTLWPSVICLVVGFFKRPSTN
jgi:hypothetical protein